MEETKLLSPILRERLVTARPMLMRKIVPCNIFWTKLVKNKVLTKEITDEIKGGGHNTAGQQIYELIDHMLKGTYKSYQGFLKTLSETNMESFVTELAGVDVSLSPTSISASGLMEHNMKLLDLDTKELLTTMKPDLMKNIIVSPIFWATLVKYKVLQTDMVDEIKHDGCPTNQISNLIEHLLKGTNERYRGFVKTLSETNHAFIVTQILEPNVHLQSTSLSTSSTANDPLDEKQRILLTNKTPALRKYLRVDDTFLKLLVSNHAISQFEVEEAMGEGKDQISYLLQYLKTGTNHTYNCFLHALSESSQAHIITDILQENMPTSMCLTFHSQEHNPTLLSKDAELSFLEKSPELMQKIRPSTSLFSLLVEHNVISDLEKNDIATSTLSHSEQVGELLRHIRTVGHYEGLICSLIEANQSDVVTDVLHDDVQGYINKFNLRSKPFIDSKDFSDAISFMRKEYKRRLRYLTPEFHSEDIAVENSKVYTPLFIKRTTKDQPKSKQIVEDEILNEKTAIPLTTLCVGEAGSGKTTLAQRLARLWANDDCISQFLGNIKAVIFVTPEDEGETFTETMRNAIPGKESYKDSIMNLLTDEPQSILIIIEALDQFHNASVLKQIKQSIKDHSSNVFLTIRKDHSLLTPHYISMFDQQIEVMGFTVEQGLVYAKKLLAEINCKPECQEFLEAIDGKPKIQTCPLNLTLACQLYVQGDLVITDLGTLTEVQLYALREKRMVEREQLINKSENLSDYMEEIQKIHSLAIYVLLHNKEYCSKDDLDYFRIHPNSPAMVLLLKHKRSSVKFGNQIFWSWPHSRLLEFDAAMALANSENLMQKKWLYWLANRPDLNPVSCLLAAILGENNKYEEVKALTTACILLQSKAHCTASDDTRDNSSHQCTWISKIRNMVENLTTGNSLIDQMNQTNTCQVPDFDVLRNCCGSLFNGNVSLFQNIKEMWKLGSLDKKNAEFIESCQNAFLPTFARTNCNADSLHIMLVNLEDWKTSLLPTGTKDITELNIHFGVKVHTCHHKFSQSEQFQDYFIDILDSIHPVMFHLYHDCGMCFPVETLVEFINERNFLIQPVYDAWNIWSCNEVAWTKQRFVSETNRSVTFSFDQGNNEIIIDTHNIQDLVLINREDNSLEKLLVQVQEKFKNICTIYINVGFPPTTTYHGNQPYETHKEWQEAILHILCTLCCTDELSIRSMKPDMLQDAISGYFVKELRSRIDYDVFSKQEDGFQFIKMHDGYILPIEVHPVAIYKDAKGTTIIRADSPSNASLVKAYDADCCEEETVGFFFSEPRNLVLSEKEIEDVVAGIKHLLLELKMKTLVFMNAYSDCNLSGVYNTDLESWGRREGYLVNIQHNLIRFDRVYPGFQRVQDINSTRSVFIKWDLDHNAVIEVSQPSDCYLLSRDHVEDKQIHILNVWFGSHLTRHINGPAEHQPPETWEEALHHLLNICRPFYCYLHCEGMETGIKDGHLVLLADETKYGAYWNISHSILSIEILTPGHQRVTDPECCRSVFITTSQEGELHIQVSQPSDCLLLDRSHAQCSDVEFLQVYFNHGFMMTINGTKKTETPTAWKMAVHHLLNTYKPKECELYANGIYNELPMKYKIKLEDGTVYLTRWNAKREVLYLSLVQDVLQVEDPAFSQSVVILEAEGNDAVIEVAQPSGCLLLLREHVQCTHIANLSVHFDDGLTSDNDQNGQAGRPDAWQTAIHHLLNTYRPVVCYLHSEGSRTGLRHSERFDLDETSYWAHWSGLQNCLAFTQFEPDLKNILKEEDNSIWPDDVLKFINAFTSRPPLSTLRSALYTLGALTEFDDGHVLELSDGTSFKTCWDESRSQFSFRELKEGFLHVKIPNISRSVFILKADGKDADIEVSRPSDCLLLQREYVQCSQVDCLSVYFDSNSIKMNDGLHQPQTPDAWKIAIHHLLSTYRPVTCVVYAKGVSTWIEDDYVVDFEDGTYCRSNASQSYLILTIAKPICVEDTVVDPQMEFSVGTNCVVSKSALHTIFEDDWEDNQSDTTEDDVVHDSAHKSENDDKMKDDGMPMDTKTRTVDNSSSGNGRDTHMAGNSSMTERPFAWKDQLIQTFNVVFHVPPTSNGST